MIEWYEHKIKFKRSGVSNEISLGCEYRFVPPGKMVEPSPLVLRDKKAIENGTFISHSVPVPGGFSGRITLELEAASPVLFGVKENDENGMDVTVPAYLKDANGYKQYVIPGRSARGVIKSVFRIATFSGLGPVNEKHSFGNRSLEYLKMIDVDSNGNQIINFDPNNLMRGWLEPVFEKKNNETNQQIIIGWKITPALPTSVKHKTYTEIGQNYGDNDDLEARRKKIGSNESLCSLSGQYVIITGSLWDKKKRESIFGEPDKNVGPMSLLKNDIDHFLLTYSNYNKNSEAVFPDGNKRSASGTFKFALRDYVKFLLKNNKVAEAKFLLEDMGIKPSDNIENIQSPYPNGLPGIPVYYFVENHDGSERIRRFGMSQVFKLRHKFSVGDVLKRRPERADKNIIDWTDAVFGTICESEDNADDPHENAENEPTQGNAASKFKRGIASRVSFSFARAGEAKLMGNIDVVQGQPKASFDPFYLTEPEEVINKLKNLEGHKDKKLATWDSETAILNGHKRYPVVIKFDNSINVTSSNLTNKVSPLEAGVKFTLDIDFHNLHPLELGALLWSISFGDRCVFTEGETTFRHSGGRLRAKGFGQLIPRNAKVIWERNPLPAELDFSNTDTIQQKIDALMCAFENEMGARIAKQSSSEQNGDRNTFYASPSISALLNLSNSAWQTKNAAPPASMFAMPKSRGRTEFAAFTGLRKMLYLKSELYNIDTVKKRQQSMSVLQEFLTPVGGEVNQQTIRSQSNNIETASSHQALVNGSEINAMLQCLRNPQAALKNWRDIQNAATSV